MFCFPQSMQRSREQLRSIPVPDRSGETTRWQGVQHGRLADMLVSRAGRAGLGVVTEKWAVSRDGQRLWGALDLDPSQKLGIQLPPGITLGMGIRHSNDFRHAVRIIVGARVMICGNGMFSSEFKPAANRRHTRSLDLGDVIGVGMHRFVEQAKTGIAEQIEKLRRIDLADARRADDILMRSGRRKLLPWSGVGKVDALWQNPPHEEFRARNGWNLYQAFTEHAKSLAPTGQFKLLQSARDIIVASVN